MLAGAPPQIRPFPVMTVNDPNEQLALEAAWRAQCAERPGFAVPLARFSDFVRARRPEEGPLAEVLATYCLPDLFLACACLAGDAAAIAAFERELAPIIDKAVASFGPQAAAEVRQGLSASLLVDHRGKGPLLQEYRGEGALRRWLRVVAVREATRLYHLVKREGPSEDEALFDSLVGPGDAAAELVGRDAAEKFRKAFSSALAELPSRERTALRLHVVDGLTIDQIAPAFDVHRATVARWISAARETALAETRRHLMRELGLGAGDADSLIRMAQSKVDLSLERLLASREQA
jgi:RNA polymerase sigma-70 factor, ECF subfamily